VTSRVGLCLVTCMFKDVVPVRNRRIPDFNLVGRAAAEHDAAV